MITISLDNDFEPEMAVTRKNTTTGVLEPAAGLTGLTFRLSATDGGTAIHADLEVTATERSGAPGVYFAILDGDKLRTHLAASYIGKVVWEVFGDGTNVFSSIERKIVERRRP
jgi:hypothetical protein